MKTKQSNSGHQRRLLGLAALALLTATTTQASYQSTVLSDTPLAYYPLDLGVDTSGTATDVTGNGNDGTYQNIYPGFNNVPGPSAYITNGVSFDGQTTLVDLSTGPNAGSLNFSGPITMEAWVQPSDSSTFGDILGKGYDSSTYQEITIRANGPYGANFYASSGSQGVSGGQQNTKWSHLVLSSDGTYTTLYVNGVMAQRTSDNTGSIMFSDPWAIGDGTSAGHTRYFYGNISQVAIYQHGLTSTQVLAHYFLGAFGVAPSNSVPVINAQPQTQATISGGTATFSVGILSALPTTNLWFKDGSPLAGQTNSTLVLNNVQSSNLGNYSVVVGNSNGTTNSAVANLNFGNSLVWSANGNTGVWDTGSSANWMNVSNSQQTVFNSGDQVLFDDTAGVPTTVSVNGTVSPSIITVNSSANVYTINGSGTISGNGSLVKKGSSLLAIVSSGNFTGPVAISGGAVYAGNNSFASVSSITITNSSTMDMGGGTFNNSKPVTISGTGFNGEGAIYNSYSDYPLESLNVTLAGDASFGGSARWDMGNGAQISGAHNLTIDWSGGASYGEWNSVTIGANVAGISLTNGSSLGMKSMDTSFQNPGTVLTVSGNSTVSFYAGGFNGSFHVLSGGLVNLWTSPSPFNGSNLILEDGANWESYYNTNGDESINSAVTLNGVAHIVIGDHNMVYTNLISGTGGLLMDAYNHQMVMQASNTYSGPTIIGGGLAVGLVGKGSISHSSLIFFGGSDSTSTHLDVSGRPDNTFTLASGQTLGGVGAVGGNLVVSAGATLAPAGTNTTIGITTGANATGTISATNTITLGGTTTIKLNGSGVNDAVQAGTGITYGGTLNLINISGADLAVGNSFQIFTAATYGGTFASITPATPGSGLAWDTSLLSSGVLGVKESGSTRPVVSSTSVVGGNLVFRGTGGTATGTYYVVTTTNLATLPGSWTVLSTNAFDGNGAFSVTNAINVGVPQRYFGIEIP